MNKLLASCLVCLVALSACEPRGETRTLEQIHTDSKDRFQKVESAAINPEAKNLVSKASKFLAAPDAAGTKDMAIVLEQLSPHASATNRTSIAELANQYRASNGSGAALELLNARTYGLLASELETAKFAQ